MIAITQATAGLGNEQLINATVYATIDLCAMCAGALVLARVKRIVFGARDPKAGAFGSVLDINRCRLNHKISVTAGVLEETASSLLKEFFSRKRACNEK